MDEPSIWTEFWRVLAANATVAAAAWGAAGGATSALVVKVTRKDALRQVALGALTSGGLGTASGAIIAKWMDLPAETIPAFGAGGAAAYLVGVFGPAVIEVLLSRIAAGKLPGDR